MILCFRCKNEVCSGFHGNRQTDTHTHTHTQTDTQNDYRNPCACAPRVNDIDQLSSSLAAGNSNMYQLTEPLIGQIG